MASYNFKRFTGINCGSNGSTTLITVPAGHTYLIKNATVYSNASNTYTLKLNATPFGSGVSQALQNPLKIDAMENVVLEAGDVLSVTCGGNTATNYFTVSGIDYTI
jgi:hypothetical protein